VFRTARLWAGTSVLFALVAVGAVVVPPSDGDPPARLAAPVTVAAPLDRPGGTTAPGPPGEPVRLQIPALGISVPVTGVGVERDGSLQVPEGAGAVGWYRRGAIPGQSGPAVLAGHVDWDGVRGAFYGLRELRPGDAVVVDRTDGTAATFRVDRVETHDKDEFPTEAVYGEIDHAGLRLITRGGAFDEGAAEYPDNVIVFASLVATG
jgi:hypothetical protein